MLDLLPDLTGVNALALLDAKEKRRLLDVQTVAQWLGQTPRTIRHWAKSGLLPSQKVGTAYLFKAEELWSYVLDGLVELELRKKKKPSNDPERQRFIKEFGPQGGVWFDNGMSFREAQKQWNLVHAEEIADKAINGGLGTNLGKLAVKIGQSPALRKARERREAHAKRMRDAGF